MTPKIAILKAVTNIQSLTWLAFATSGAVEAGVVVAIFKNFFWPAAQAAEKGRKLLSTVFAVTTVTIFFLLLRKIE